MKIHNYDEVCALLKTGRARSGMRNPENIVIPLVLAGEKCSDGGEYGEDIVATPLGWRIQSSIDGFYCSLTGDQMDFLRDPCDTCPEFERCQERGFLNDYPVTIPDEPAEPY